MNVLSMIKDRQIKAQRRFEAELMMAKAYRALPTSMSIDSPSNISQCSYRGQSYTVPEFRACITALRPYLAPGAVGPLRRLVAVGAQLPGHSPGRPI